MARVNKIPVENIYHMLSYSWTSLREKELVNVSGKDFHNLYNLFARIYTNGLTSLLKRGLNRYYIEENQDIYGVKGKINLNNSINNMGLFVGRMNCDFDEFSSDMIFNQILKTTINILLKAPQLDLSYKNELIKRRPYFQSFTDIELSISLFKQLKFNRNNSHYRLLIDISELIYRNSLADEKDGEYIFRDYLRDKEMANLFERFILNFYKFHLSLKRYKVHSPWIYWNTDHIDISQESILPVMKTDIVIEDKQERQQLIMDTKFYSRTLAKNIYGDGFTAHSANLYQMFSYVQNSKYDGEVRGILLYPQIQEELDHYYSILGKSIGLSTINLNDDWRKIEDRLLDLVNKSFKEDIRNINNLVKNENLIWY